MITDAGSIVKRRATERKQAPSRFQRALPDPQAIFSVYQSSWRKVQLGLVVSSVELQLDVDLDLHYIRSCSATREDGMSTSDKIAWTLSCMIFVLLGSNSRAFEIDGAWATDAAKCAKVFVKKSNKISMTKHADLFGGGFIVEGGRIRGTLATCKINNRKEDGDVLHLIASCSTEISILSPMQLDIKIEDTNKIVRFF
jgi:hypothetical protein